MNPQNPTPAPATTPAPQAPKTTFGEESKWNEIVSTIAIILLAPLVALLLINFVFQSYQVEGPSMEETLYNEDRLIVTKTGRTWARLTGDDYLPKRYEVVIFNHSGSFGGEEVAEKQLVKRVIGLPGDRVVISEGIVKIFNAENPNGFLVDKLGPENETVSLTPGGDVDETVKTGQVYVLGDNRHNSLDSRAFGTVRSQDIVGTVALRIFPFDKFEKF